MTLKILFVCTGNTCRSPMAEAFLNHQAPAGFHAKSAGVFANEGASAARNAITVLQENDIPITHNAQQLKETELFWADLILTMTASHKALIMNQFPGAADKIFTLKEYVNGGEGDLDVFDPYGGDVEMYRETFAELKQLISKLLQSESG